MSRFRRLLLFALAGTAVLACADGDATVPVAPRWHELAIVELTFRNIGKPNMTASTIVPEDTAIRFDGLSVGFLDHAKTTGAATRYIHALFRIRNAFRQVDGTIPSGVTLVGVSTALTVPGTPFSMVTTESGAAASTAFVQQVRATGRASFTGDGVVVVDSANVLRVFAASETLQPTMRGITHVFNFGYVVGHADANEGVATVAFALPLLDDRTENPTALSVMLLVRLELP